MSRQREGLARDWDAENRGGREQRLQRTRGCRWRLGCRDLGCWDCRDCRDQRLLYMDVIYMPVLESVAVLGRGAVLTNKCSLQCMGAGMGVCNACCCCFLLPVRSWYRQAQGPAEEGAAALRGARHRQDQRCTHRGQVRSGHTQAMIVTPQPGH